ncbi:xylose isomerase [Leptospira congkakensis]|uniref:Xylose isomerase n=1 Tax=Leptospira congkakensis TaxID=2484932 RepID=A0A4Z1A5D2_9LEPT|nr:metabolite traffic protein EboE [Leptospira congkakensis]TGL87193.1 xylose isomerase [Leptospira congkakensis]TGL96761.1 xylose isomerase [Leptospira congkakensis]TGL97610.1 xylose isomerase [Leptospira congkakensis]
MKTKYGHLTYCSNIHPGETWSDHFLQLKENLPKIRKTMAPNSEMGLGLRLANEASIELLNPKTMYEFQTWLKDEGFYVFLINGFPYGNFHQTNVKENVYKPDWATKERLEYTIRLFSILSQLLPAGMEGGVSTPPLSYQYFDSSDSERNKRISFATQNILEILLHLIQIQKETGKTLHLDIEPEPDGILGNVNLWVKWFIELFLPLAISKIQNHFGFSKEIAEDTIRKHIRICLDVCHSAVSFERNQTIVNILKENLIQVGRIQISSALKVIFNQQRKEQLDLLTSFNEPTYLHQVLSKKNSSELVSFPDLPEALEKGAEPNEEWRIHFHVPVFLDSYGLVSSTRNELLELLSLQKKYLFTNALEIETYTWGVLPKELQLPISDSIIREVQWVLSVLENQNDKIE